MTTSRALVIGLDGGTYDLLTPLCAAGVMPNLAALMQSSALGELQSTRPFITPVAWTSFQTGCDPQEHGIWDYRYLDHARRQVRLNDSRRIERSTIFDCLAAEGGQTVSLNLPMTFPAPDVPGLIVGGLDSPSLEAAMERCQPLYDALKRQNIPCSLGTIWKRVPRSFEELAAKVDETEADFQGRAAAAEMADSLCDWRLMIVQFQTLDALQHRCWHLLSEESGAPEAWTSKARQALRALDQAVGRLLELADRRRAQVLVVSDHGFGAFRGTISLPSLLESCNLLRHASWPNQLGSRLARVGWKTRKWLHRRRQPRASTASLARPLEALAPIDWRRSVATVLHGNLAALVYLNTRQRFGMGPLESEASIHQAREATMAALREARHPETCEPLFDEVYATQERYDCDPVERCWPDVIGIPVAGFHTRTKFDTETSLLVGDEHLTGTHRQSGVLMVQGNGVATQSDSLRPETCLARDKTAELRDVAPTLLHLLGIAPPDCMTGRILHELLTNRPLRRSTAPRAVGEPVHCHALSAMEQETVEARLRDLGYLD
jgi:predicted AlkP superfamily phosphohydrolase/phosphomutase